jgi:hypothetical protein
LGNNQWGNNQGGDNQGSTLVALKKISVAEAVGCFSSTTSADAHHSPNAFTSGTR